jgi:hypothetical protein
MARIMTVVLTLVLLAGGLASNVEAKPRFTIEPLGTCTYYWVTQWARDELPQPYLGGSASVTLFYGIWTDCDLETGAFLPGHAPKAR